MIFLLKFVTLIDAIDFYQKIMSWQKQA